MGFWERAKGAISDAAGSVYRGGRNAYEQYQQDQHPMQPESMWTQARRTARNYVGRGGRALGQWARGQNGGLGRLGGKVANYFNKW